MSIYLRINMEIGLDGLLTLEEDTVVKSCIFYWGGEYDPCYPYNQRGFIEESKYKQIEICDIPVREINWVITELRKMEWQGE
ncbi:MAG: hypothetical protein EBU66_18070 [Bacteroidetes bacterium]|nr:hypothetical protein [bacterium]NBP66539.1 hypothetical protein [Bacteroidota bacterium]